MDTKDCDEEKQKGMQVSQYGNVCVDRELDRSTKKKDNSHKSGDIDTRIQNVEINRKEL